MSDQLLQVLAVEISTSKVLWAMNGKTERAAQYAIEMAIYRQGVEDRFFTTAPDEKFKAGDAYADAPDSEE